MIYLLDENSDSFKKLNTVSSPLIDKYSKIIKHIPSKSEYTREKLYQKNNTIICEDNFLKKEIPLLTHQISNAPKVVAPINVLFFSNSDSPNNLNKNSLSSKQLYENLGLFLENYDESDPNFDIFKYGENYALERELKEINQQSVEKIRLEDSEKVNCTNALWVESEDISSLDLFENPIDSVKAPNLSSDKDITQWIDEVLNKNEYSNILIPLCFDVLSDFNGLALATHIRCTEGINRLTKIIIYGSVGIEYLYNNPFFNILKTKDVSLSILSKSALNIEIKKEPKLTSNKVLKNEIKKLKLEIPEENKYCQNFQSNWTLYRWSQRIGVEDQLDEKFEQIQHNIYFKYLKTINETSSRLNSGRIEYKMLINNKKHKRNILLIDKNAKNWGIFFKNFFAPSLSKISFDSLNYNDDGNEKFIIENISKTTPDLIILGLNLFPKDDFVEEIKDFSGFKILKQIKDKNLPIQVILFSTLNKTKTLREALNNKADGFILKNSEEDTAHSLKVLKQNIEKNLNDFYFLAKELNNVIIKKYVKCDTKIHCERNKEFGENIISNIEMSKMIFNIKGKKQIGYAYIALYNCFELIGERYVKITNDGLINDKGERLKIWKWNDVNQNFEINPTPSNISTFHKITSLCLSKNRYQNGSAPKFIHLKNMRNDFIHSTKSIQQNDLIELIRILKIIFNKLDLF